MSYALESAPKGTASPTGTCASRTVCRSITRTHPPVPVVTAWVPLRATNSTMASVGIRELRQRASELLRRVEDGESIEITDRGRPVAVLAPLPADPIERLIAAGDLQPSTGDIADLPAPLM